MKRLLIAATLAAITGLAPQAGASDWGCKVLLCASSPNWRAVPECHPPMYKLISCLAAFNPCSFPTCPEGGSGEPGYSQYEDCPEGSSPAANPSSSGDRGLVSTGGSSEMSMCARKLATTGTCTGSRSSAGVSFGKSCEAEIVLTPRPRRAKPWYFNIKDDTSGETKQHWFELND